MFLCEVCSMMIGLRGEQVDNPVHVGSLTTRGCEVCLGLWCDDDEYNNGNSNGICVNKNINNQLVVKRLTFSILQAMKPYGKPQDNCWSERCSPPTIVLPGDLVYRFRLAKHQQQQQNQCESNEPSMSTSDIEFANRAKRRAKNLLAASLSCIPTMAEGCHTNDYKDDRIIRDEEQGYLCLHILLVPSSTTPRPTLVKDLLLKRKNKRKRRFIHPGHDHGLPQQGGDPRTNLEQRLSSHGIASWTINQALSSETMSSTFTTTTTNDHPDVRVDPTLASSTSNPFSFDMHVIVWRRPLYIRGDYTKTRRDVSQSPFFTVQQGESLRLGVTSVEEQITSVVARHVGGISTQNNIHHHDDSRHSCDVVFGAVKFHASGREDMDVRMLLPSPPISSPRDEAAISSSHATIVSSTIPVERLITGRPFVCEVIDALRMPSKSNLTACQHEINHTTSTGTSNGNGSPNHNSNNWYGCNPLGVGVSPLSFVSSTAFQQLQTETEHKVKHYACLCWSERPLRSTFLLSKLEEKMESKMPLTIAQKTPIRVLHRRAPLVRDRTILSCRIVELLDEHYFRLQLRTQAGTYVKEFVHGDLGRTNPSLSTLLFEPEEGQHSNNIASDDSSNRSTSTTGLRNTYRMDILELDCEGVEVNEEP